jgi:bifunctional UDP-N-acetylglucosamine pyrophosphorylase / glucosamine-1-phosphate N-acetyltransferase
MTSRSLATVVMAAGRGTRMRSRTPKHLQPLLGRRMLDWVLAAAEPLETEPLVVVCSPDTLDELRGSTSGVSFAVQQEPRGTGDAVASARSALEGFDGDLLVISGDTPLVTPELLAGLVDAHRGSGPAATILTVEPAAARPYGRIVRGADGGVREVVEAADATPEQLAIREQNSSIYVFSAAALWGALEHLDAHNAQGELYLTDTIARLVADGERVEAHRADDPAAAEGVNTRGELAEAAAALRDRVNARHLGAGVGIVDPASTWIDADAELEADAVIHPFTVVRGHSRVAAGAEVGPHAVVVDAVVGEGALVGPFCYLRPGTVLERGAKAGTFVEIKNSRIGEGSKVPHLSYVGDAEVGERTNVGAGAITANFPHRRGQPKGRTTIGRDVRVGVHNAFVAPVEIGDDSWTAAGTVVTDDVPPGSLAGFPPRQVTKEGYVRRDDD